MVNWNGYLVSEDGTIYNKDGSIKSVKVNKKGYLFTNFYYDGKVHTKLIHRIVAEVYLGDIPLGMEVDHINNVRSDNRVENLQYLTKSENNKKAYLSGNRDFLFGDTNPNSLVRKASKNVQRLDRKVVGETS